jgi:hypothetical protein
VFSPCVSLKVPEVTTPVAASIVWVHVVTQVLKQHFLLFACGFDVGLGW